MRISTDRLHGAVRAADITYTFPTSSETPTPNPNIHAWSNQPRNLNPQQIPTARSPHRCDKVLPKVLGRHLLEHLRCRLADSKILVGFLGVFLAPKPHTPLNAKPRKNDTRMQDNVGTRAQGPITSNIPFSTPPSISIPEASIHPQKTLGNSMVLFGLVV